MRLLHNQFKSSYNIIIIVMPDSWTNHSFQRTGSTVEVFQTENLATNKLMCTKSYDISQKFSSKIWINSFNRFWFWVFIHCSSYCVKGNEVWRWPLLIRCWETWMGLYSWTVWSIMSKWHFCTMTSATENTFTRS